MRKFLTFLIALFLLTSRLHAFPSSIYWTVCTTDVVQTGDLAIDISDYFTLFTNEDTIRFFPPDMGLTLGVFCWKNWEAEVGFDYFGGVKYPWFFNAKIGIKEDKLCKGCPGFSVGIFNMGTKPGINDFNIVDVVIGKTLPASLTGSRFFVGGYVGSKTLRKDQVGYLVAFVKEWCKKKDCYDREYSQWGLIGDYASGKNFVGGGGVGLVYNYNSKLGVITGPTWFENTQIYGRWKWTVQVFITTSVFDAKCTP